MFRQTNPTHKTGTDGCQTDMRSTVFRSSNYGIHINQNEKNEHNHSTITHLASDYKLGIPTHPVCL